MEKLTFVTKASVQKDTGLVGKKGVLKVHDKQVLEAYSFAPMDKVPIEVVDETPTFLVCKVLPHQHKGPMSCGPSREYRITVDKFDLRVGYVSIDFK